jgi:hypothetical protein
VGAPKRETTATESDSHDSDQPAQKAISSTIAKWKGCIHMTRQVLTTIGAATAIAAAVGGCLLLGPIPQAQAAAICDSKNTMNCVTFNPGGGFTATNGKNTGTVTFNPFCVIVNTTKVFGC